MGRNLVIVESPAKAKTINKYLGKEFIVKSSVGHVRDLPTSGSTAGTKKVAKKKTAKKAKLTPEQKKAQDYEKLKKRLAVDPDNGWEANYQILPGKEKVLAELQALADKSDTVYLATDLDREGEAIAWHLREALGGKEDRYKRVTFSEITKKALTEAFSQPTELNMNRVQAQQARRFLDRVVGYMVSPLLWKKVARGLSAGRVQSVAVRLITEREKEIKAFNPEEYWEMAAHFATTPDFKAKVARHNGNAYRPTSKSESDKYLAEIQNSEFVLKKREDKPKTSNPTAPFITSTLQQAASQRLRFSVKKTMMMAQKLYEAGYITYMRTDSTHLSDESINSARSYISSTFGSDYLPASPKLYASRDNAQEAHEAIRPSDVYMVPSELVGKVESDQHRLYDLIWRRFVACQMPAARFDTTSFTIAAGAFELKASGRIMKFDGFRKVFPSIAKGDNDSPLPNLKEGETLSVKSIVPSQHYTKPPPRFTEAKLVQELEKRGIGRPSTYASIISTIQDRGYVKAENRRFYALKMGEIVADRLVHSFTDLMGYDFTAKMEEQLDSVASGQENWQTVLNDFYKNFRGTLEKAEENMVPSDPTPTNISCPKCGRDMMVRTASTGVFLSCSGYTLPPKERCKGTINLQPGDEFIGVDDDKDSDSQDSEAGSERGALELISKKRCPKCSTAMDSYIVDETRKLHVCGNNPECDGFTVEEGKFVVKGYEGPLIECDKCGSDMQLKTGRFGKYFGCTNENCSNTRKLLRNGEAAPPKADPIPMPELPCEQTDGYFILRDGAAGIFLASSLFPKSRETRKPKVEDLKRHREELDEKFLFIADGPAKDPDGNDYLVKFARKNKEYFLGSDDSEGKATGWTAKFDEGKWKESNSKSAAGKKTTKKKVAKKKTTTKKVVKKKTAKRAKKKKVTP